MVFDLLIRNWHLVWKGLVITLECSALIVVCATVIGVIGGLLLLYGPLPLRILVRIYVDTIRGIPLLVSIFAIFYGLPALGSSIDAFWSAILALSVFGGAHVSEVVRGGVNSIPIGQTEAGMAIGLTFYKRLLYVIFPQAISRIIPPWTNTAVELVKGSSLLALVSVIDLLYSTQQIASRTRQPLFFYGVAAVIYFILNYSISTIGRRIERKFTY